MRLFRHPRWQHLDYRVKVATTQENKPPTQGTRQWTFTTPRWWCGSILLPSLNAGVPEPTGGSLSVRLWWALLIRNKDVRWYLDHVTLYFVHDFTIPRCATRNRIHACPCTYHSFSNERNLQCSTITHVFMWYEDIPIKFSWIYLALMKGRLTLLATM